MNIHEVGCGGIYWIELAEDRDRMRALVNTVLLFISNAENILTGKEAASFSRVTVLRGVSQSAKWLRASSGADIILGLFKIEAFLRCVCGVQSVDWEYTY
jgi:hypothetical protein